MLVVDAAGNVFGSTLGTMDLSSQDSGTVFEISAGTTTLNTLANFQSEPNLIGVDSSGNLYGVSYPAGGISYNTSGTLFEIVAANKQLVSGISVSSSDSGGGFAWRCIYLRC